MAQDRPSQLQLHAQIRVFGITAALPALAVLIAASILLERDRADLSLTEPARRAGIAESTLS